MGQKGLSGQFLLFPRGFEVPRIWSRKGPDKAPIDPGGPISPEKARFSRADFPLIFSENLGLKPPFVISKINPTGPPPLYCGFGRLLEKQKQWTGGIYTLAGDASQTMKLCDSAVLV